MYGLQDVDKIYKDKIKFYCPNFLCTAGAEKIALRTASVSKEYDIPPLKVPSERATTSMQASFTAC